jgi:hypothetical protein
VVEVVIGISSFVVAVNFDVEFINIGLDVVDKISSRVVTVVVVGISFVVDTSVVIFGVEGVVAVFVEVLLVVAGLAFVVALLNKPLNPFHPFLTVL